MRKRSSFVVAAAAILAFSVPGLAQTHAPQAPAAPFQPVSALVDLPDFIPGMGSLFVDPATLPAGPFLAYDHDGKLVSSIYMIPLAAMNEQKNFDGLAVGDGDVDHVDIQFNAGHPGVAEPHYHVVLWYVSPDEATALR
ncbi:MAG TPA: hypothetical protein VFH11_00220 [Gemmatimonadota bacterium]|nr:hypothetical protein [Gemmatimonadota bacterium]